MQITKGFVIPNSGFQFGKGGAFHQVLGSFTIFIWGRVASHLWVYLGILFF
jgi:hypothetical protein